MSARLRRFGHACRSRCRRSETLCVRFRTICRPQPLLSLVAASEAPSLRASLFHASSSRARSSTFEVGTEAWSAYRVWVWPTTSVNARYERARVSPGTYGRSAATCIASWRESSEKSTRTGSCGTASTRAAARGMPCRSREPATIRASIARGRSNAARGARRAHGWPRTT